MRKLLTIAAVLVIVIWGATKLGRVAHASIDLTGDESDSRPGTRSWNVRGFDRVALRGSDDVIVRVGPAESVTASGPADALDRLEAEVRDGQLRLGRKKEGWSFGWRSKPRPVVFTVTVPRLAGAAVAGSGDMKVDRVQGAAFRGAVAGSGSLAIAALRADTASFDIAGSGDTQVAGQARALDLSIAGSGDFAGQGLRSQAARIKIAGSGDVKATVDGEADVSVMGSGDVDIFGKPVCQVKKMGSGDVRCPA